MLLSFLVFVGFAELRLGTRRAALTCVGCQLLGVLGAAAFLAVDERARLALGGRAGARAGRRVLRGALGAAAAATVTLPSPWRGRVRVVLLTYGVAAFLYLGALWDVEHLIAIIAGLAVGPRLVGRRSDLTPRTLSRHEYRLLAAAAFFFSAAASLFSPYAPAGGPLTMGMEDTETAVTSGVVFAVIWRWWPTACAAAVGGRGCSP